MHTPLALACTCLSFLPPSEFQASAAAEVELLANPTFADQAKGWALRGADPEADAGRDQSPAVLLHAVDEQGGLKWSHVGIVIDSPPTARELRFQCWVKAAGSTQGVMVNAFGYDQSKKNTLANWSQSIELEPDEWQLVEAKYVLDRDVAQFTLWVINQTDRDMWVCDAHLIAGDAAVPEMKNLDGPGVIRASAFTAVAPSAEGTVGWVTFPIPGTYREQVPLTFDLVVDPPDALRQFRWRLREDGLNWLCEIEVAPPADGASVRWESLVLVRDRAEIDLAGAEKIEAPEATLPWLKSTACVQSDDPDIRAKAEELALDAGDVKTFVEHVLAFTSTNQGRNGAAFDSLDARKALDCGGSCTSRANLCAALLRAHGIPARTVAHLPTWSGPLYEHWLVEYWHPGAGWVWIESSLGKAQPQPWSLVVLNVANPADEDRSFAPTLRHSNVMSGAPELAVHMHSENLLPAFAKRGAEGAPNWARPVLRTRGEPAQIDALFAAARAAYGELARESASGQLAPTRTQKIEAALRTGDMEKLRLELRSGS